MPESCHRLYCQIIRWNPRVLCYQERSQLHTSIFAALSVFAALSMVSTCNTTNFYKLLAEFNHLILQHCTSPDDLYSFILASSVHYHIFKIDKQRIIAATIRNIFSPFNPITAFRALTVGKFAFLRDRQHHETATLRSSWIMEHIYEHTEEKQSYLSFESGRITDKWKGLVYGNAILENLIPLCRQWRLIDYFVLDYS